MTMGLMINAGSSSIKWRLYGCEDQREVARGQVERIGMPPVLAAVTFGGQTHRETLGATTTEGVWLKILDQLSVSGRVGCLDDIEVVGHRIVAGGPRRENNELTPERLAELAKVTFQAPLHNPIALTYVRLAQRYLSQAKHIGVFESDFFADLPPARAQYALPPLDTGQPPLNKIGEHGINHDYVAKQAAQLLNRPLAELKIVSLHLGSGSSVAAIKGGHIVDTSMGVSVLPGLVMGTRAGTVDPTVLPIIMEQFNLNSLNEALDFLNTACGLLGVSGISSDIRDLHQAAQDGHPRASLALEMFVDAVTKNVGTYLAALEGADALIFTGGIGEHDDIIRQRTCQRLAWLGIELDEAANRHSANWLSTATSSLPLLRVPANEEWAMLGHIRQQLALT